VTPYGRDVSEAPPLAGKQLDRRREVVAASTCRMLVEVAGRGDPGRRPSRGADRGRSPRRTGRRQRQQRANDGRSNGRGHPRRVRRGRFWPVIITSSTSCPRRHRSKDRPDASNQHREWYGSAAAAQTPLDPRGAGMGEPEDCLRPIAAAVADPGQRPKKRRRGAGARAARSAQRTPIPVSVAASPIGTSGSSEIQTRSRLAPASSTSSRNRGAPRLENKCT